MTNQKKKVKKYNTKQNGTELNEKKERKREKEKVVS